MTEIYGHRWTSSFGDKADPEHAWASVLKGLSGSQIANGLNALIDKGREFDWPPPANVFRSLCQQMAGMPCTKDAWMEALAGKYSHEAVRIAAEATSTFELKAAEHGDKSLFQRFEHNYAMVQRRALTGQSLDGKIPQAIGHEGGMRAQLALSHRIARELMTAQNIPTDPKAARALLLAKVGIRRQTHA